MKKNMNSADRVIRIIIAAIAITLYSMNIISGALGMALIIISGIFVLTSLVSFCPLYAIFGISTCAVKESE